MKNESAYARKFKALLRRMKPPDAEPPPVRDSVTQMIIGFLEWEASRRQAELAFNRLFAVLVDNNDLRISHASEIMELIGPRYPLVEERVERMRDALQEVYVREHAVQTYSLRDKSKKDVRAYFDSLPGMTPYVAAQVLLLSYGAHAVPVDQKLTDLLIAQQVVDADATPAQAAHFIERQVKAGDAVDAHLRLRAWVDAGAKRVRAAKRTTKKARKPGKTAGSAAKKKTAKRSTQRVAKRK